MALAIPTIISSLVMVIYNLADTYFVGMLNDPVQNAAVTLAAPVLLAFNAVNNLFGVGSSSMMSRALGKRDYDTVYRSSAFGFYGSLFCGVLFSLIYSLFSGPLLTMLGAGMDTIHATGGIPEMDCHLWRCTGHFECRYGLSRAFRRCFSACQYRHDERLPAEYSPRPDFYFAVGTEYGCGGRGARHLSIELCGMPILFVLLFIKRRNTYVCVRPSMFRMNKAIIVGVCGVGIPAAIQNLLNVTGMTVLNNFTSSYGSDAVAAMGIAQKINMVPLYIALGLSQGIMPLISYNYASGNIDRMKRALTFSIKIALFFMAAVSVGYYWGAGFLTSLFMKTRALSPTEQASFMGCVCHCPFSVWTSWRLVFFRPVAWERKRLFFALLRKIVLEIPALCLLNRLFPLYGLAYAQFAAELILSFAAIWVLLCMFRRLKEPHNTIQNSL